MKRIDIITNTPAIKWDDEKFGIDELLAAGWKPSIIDISMLVEPEAHRLVKQALPEKLQKYVIVQKSWRQVSERYQVMTDNTTDHIVVIFCQQFDLDQLPYYRIIKKYNIEYAYFSPDITPSATEISSKKKRLMDRVKNYAFRLSRRPVFTIASSLIKRLPNRMLGVEPAKCFFAAGDNDSQITTLMTNMICDKDTQVVSVPAFNFSQCVKAFRDDSRIIPNKYFLFLDQGLPIHPDLKRSGMKINAENYYGVLMPFLEQVEMLTGLACVIAGHPRIDYKANKVWYREYPVIQFATPKLIKDAEFVITHNSTAISQIAFFKKPTLFCTTNELNVTEEGLFYYLSEYFDVPVLNLDQMQIVTGDTLKKYICENQKRCEEYCRQFLYREYDAERLIQKTTWEYIVEHLQTEMERKCKE